jgi:hypothetical protein
MLCAFLKFHFPFSPVLSGRFRCRRSRSATALSCTDVQLGELGLWNTVTGLASGDIPVHALNEDIYHIVTGISNMQQAVQTEPALALSIAALMSLTWYIRVYVVMNQIYISVYTVVPSIYNAQMYLIQWIW